MDTNRNEDATTDQEDGAHNCSLCHRTFAQASSLKRHIRTHTGERPFKCRVCGRAYTQSGSLRRHQRSHPIIAVKPHRCPFCHLRFETMEYKTHQPICSMRSPIRPLVARPRPTYPQRPTPVSAFNTTLQHLQHMPGSVPRVTGSTLPAAQAEMSLRCVSCGFLAGAPSQLLSHIMVAHPQVTQMGDLSSVPSGASVAPRTTDMQPTTLPLVPASATRALQALTKPTPGVPQRQAALPPLQIPALGSTNSWDTRSGSFESQQRTTPSQTSSSGSGSNSGKNSNDSGSASKNSNDSSGSASKNSNDSNGSTSSEEKHTRPFKCHVCKKRFTRADGYRIHLRTHTGERPYKCSQCSRGFAQVGTLQVHMRTHTGEKPYSCKDCASKFATQGQLRAHQRTHTGERPYKCKACGRAFTQSSSLKRHQHSHHADLRARQRTSMRR